MQPTIEDIRESFVCDPFSYLLLAKATIGAAVDLGDDAWAIVLLDGTAQICEWVLIAGEHSRDGEFVTRHSDAAYRKSALALKDALTVWSNESDVFYRKDIRFKTAKGGAS